MMDPKKCGEAASPSPTLSSGTTDVIKKSAASASTSGPAVMSVASTAPINSMSPSVMGGSASDKYLGFGYQDYTKQYNPAYPLSLMPSGTGHRTLMDTGAQFHDVSKRAQLNKAENLKLSKRIEELESCLGKAGCIDWCKSVLWFLLFVLVIGAWLITWRDIGGIKDLINQNQQQAELGEKNFMENQRQATSSVVDYVNSAIQVLQAEKKPEAIIPPLVLANNAKQNAQRILDHLGKSDTWVLGATTIVWFLGMTVFTRSFSLTVLLSAAVQHTCPGLMMIPSILLPAMPLVLAGGLWVWLLPVLGVIEFLAGNRGVSFMTLMGFAVGTLMKHMELSTTLCAINSLLPFHDEPFFLLGMAFVPILASFFMWFGVKMLGYTQILIFPDGKKTITRRGYNWFMKTFSFPSGNPTPPPTNEGGPKWRQVNPKVPKPETKFTGWREYESKTKVSITVPFSKLCEHGYYQVLDKNEVVGMGVPYRGHFVIPFHVWEALQRPKMISVRHVVGRETTIYTMDFVGQFERPSTEEVDDGMVWFRLPPGIKSISPDKEYIRSQEGPVVMYSYIDGQVHVSSALGVSNRHWASTMPGSSGAPVLAARTGNLVGIHTSGAGSSNVMVLTPDLDEMIEAMGNSEEEEENDDYFPPGKVGDILSALKQAEGKNKPWKGKAKKKKGRLPKLWTDEEYASYLDQGFTREQLLDAAVEYWKAHPEEWQAAIHGEEIGFEARIRFAQTLISIDESETEEFESKNGPPPPAGGETVGLGDSSTQSDSDLVVMIKDIISTHGLDGPKHTESQSTNQKSAKSRKNSARTFLNHK